MRSDFRTLATRIRYDMFRQELAPGTRLPSIVDYAKLYRVSKPTIIRAMRILAEENAVSIIPGRGIYSIGLDGDPGAHADRPRDLIEQHIRAAARDTAPGAAVPISTGSLMRQFGVSYRTVRRVELRLEVLLVIRRDVDGRYVKPWH